MRLVERAWRQIDGAYPGAVVDHEIVGIARVAAVAFDQIHIGLAFLPAPGRLHVPARLAQVPGFQRAQRDAHAIGGGQPFVGVLVPLGFVAGLGPLVAAVAAHIAQRAFHAREALPQRYRPFVVVGHVQALVLDVVRLAAVRHGLTFGVEHLAPQPAGLRLQRGLQYLGAVVARPARAEQRVARSEHVPVQARARRNVVAAQEGLAVIAQPRVQGQPFPFDAVRQVQAHHVVVHVHRAGQILDLAEILVLAVAAVGAAVRIGLLETLEPRVDLLHLGAGVGCVCEHARAHRVEIYPAFERPGVLLLLFLAEAARGVLRQLVWLERDQLVAIGLAVAERPVPAGLQRQAPAPQQMVHIGAYPARALVVVPAGLAEQIAGQRLAAVAVFQRQVRDGLGAGMNAELAQEVVDAVAVARLAGQGLASVVHAHVPAGDVRFAPRHGKHRARFFIEGDVADRRIKALFPFRGISRLALCPAVLLAFGHLLLGHLGRIPAVIHVQVVLA
ncbi:hypothetical protein D3C85_801510 [compost metagenome]